ncbi:MAG: hypothetical protein ACT4QE_14290 [Anaerolineales bacterium]
MLNRVSGFFSRYKGLMILVGIACVVLNFIFRLFGLDWLSPNDLFLHLGIVLGLFGIVLAQALG